MTVGPTPEDELDRDHRRRRPPRPRSIGRCELRDRHGDHDTRPGSPTSRAACPASTSTGCCPTKASTSARRSSAPKGPASWCSARPCRLIDAKPERTLVVARLPRRRTRGRSRVAGPRAPSSRPGRHRQEADRVHAAKRAASRRASTCCPRARVPPGRVRRRHEGGSRRAGRALHRSDLGCDEPPRPSASTTSGRSTSSGRCASPGSAPPRTCPGCRRASRMGGRRRAARAGRRLPARLPRAARRVRLRRVPLRSFRPGLRPLPDRLRPGHRRKASRSGGGSSTAPPISSSPTADRCPASTATGRRAPRCCRRCTAPSSSTRSREFKDIWDPDGKMNPGKVVRPHGPDDEPAQWA